MNAPITPQPNRPLPPRPPLEQFDLPITDWTSELPDRLKQTLRMLYNEQMREERFRREMEEMIIHR